MVAICACSAIVDSGLPLALDSVVTLLLHEAGNVIGDSNVAIISVKWLNI